jgi:hypothetical protein
VRDLAILVLHLLATIARLAGPGGARSVVAESVLVKHQLLILNRSRKRSPNLRPSNRVVAGWRHAIDDAAVHAKAHDAPRTLIHPDEHPVCAHTRRAGDTCAVSALDEGATALTV